MPNNEYKRIWDKTLSLINDNNSIGRILYDTIVVNIIPISYKDNIFTVYIDTLYGKNMIEARCQNDILAALQQVEPSIAEFHITNSFDDTNVNDSNEDLSIDIESARKNANLKDQYTFYNFVKGDCNDFAFNVSKAVAKEPGNIETNPVFFYGGVGLGKTHLMQSIGNEVLERDKNKKVHYVSFDTFFSEYTDALSSKSKADFNQKYRSLNVLLIDDIQFIAKKERAQDEIFHIFEFLKNENVQIVFTSDRHPREIENLTDRLESRFANCLVDITKPDLETRIAIIKNKCSMRDVNLPDDIIYYLAENVDTNVRALENAFNKIVQFIKFSKVKINLDLAKEVLKPYIEENNKKEITVQAIIEEVAKYYNIKVEDILGSKRTATIAKPRQISMYLTRKLTSESLPSLGKKFNRDHSTVISGINKIDKLLKEDTEVLQAIYDLENVIKGN